MKNQNVMQSTQGLLVDPFKSKDIQESKLKTLKIFRKLWVPPQNLELKTVSLVPSFVQINGAPKLVQGCSR